MGGPLKNLLHYNNKEYIMKGFEEILLRLVVTLVSGRTTLPTIPTTPFTYFYRQDMVFQDV